MLWVCTSQVDKGVPRAQRVEWKLLLYEEYSPGWIFNLSIHSNKSSSCNTKGVCGAQLLGGVG